MAAMVKPLTLAIDEIATLPEADQEEIALRLSAHVDKIRRLRADLPADAKSARLERRGRPHGSRRAPMERSSPRGRAGVVVGQGADGTGGVGRHWNPATNSGASVRLSRVPGTTVLPGMSCAASSGACSIHPTGYHPPDEETWSRPEEDPRRRRRHRPCAL
jgi:hypothetical protein